MSGVVGYVGWVYSILCFVVVCVLHRDIVVCPELRF